MNENFDDFGNLENMDSSTDPFTDWLKQLPKPCVYCGPTMRGISNQFAVYTNGIPKPLQDFVREHPAAKGLLVSTERFPKVRMALETSGSAQQILFRQLLQEIQ